MAVKKCSDDLTRQCSQVPMYSTVPSYGTPGMMPSAGYGTMAPAVTTGYGGMAPAVPSGYGTMMPATPTGYGTMAPADTTSYGTMMSAVPASYATMPTAMPMMGLPTTTGGPTFELQPGPPVQQDINYNQGFLRTQIGRRVKIEFLIGTNMFIDREGTLVDVGISYILIREVQTNDLVMCDIYSIKFVKIFR